LKRTLKASARRSWGLFTVILFVTILIASTPASGAKPTPLNHFVGSLHEHSGYSDGWPGTRPSDYFASAKGFGLDFLGSGEHSDNADIPATFSDGCADPSLTAKCAGGDDEEPLNSVRKWEATLEQARAATDENFTGFRGFEWTSDRFGHINVYFSKNDTNAKIDGGYAGTMDTFWNWFRTPPELDGGSDGLATFNHPDGKRLIEKEVQRVEPSFHDPATNWNDFAYVPEADDRMVGIEVYNDEDEFGTTRGPGAGFYVHALDKGWHLGAVGAEDLHGKPEPDREPADNQWGHPLLPKTVIIAPDRSEASLRAAMHARRFYATRFNQGLRIEFTVDRAMMGSRLVRPGGRSLLIEASTNQPGLTLEIVTSGGKVVASGTTSLRSMVRASSSDRYYFLRVIDPNVFDSRRYVAYSSPVWVEASGGSDGPSGEWLAGDLHVHTCYSHDAYCPPDDFNTPPEEFWTLSGTVEERFIEASVRGLDYLAITDHHDDGRPGDSGAGGGPVPPPWEDPGFGTHGVIGIPGYENSLSGHAQMLGATKVYWLQKTDGSPDKSAAAVQAIADELRADGGVFQANHPTDPPHDLRERVQHPTGGLPPLVPLACDDTSWMDWGYGFDVTVDSVEVWNFSHALQPPIPAMSGNGDAVRYWECWLQRGDKVAATGGSDSHWLSTSAVQGSGNPTTWVFASDRSLTGILQALKEGRTSVSILPPTEGAVQLYLEADRNGDGTFESMIGDTVPPGSKLRVRASGLPGPGFVEIRANGATLHQDVPLLPGGAFTFEAPNVGGWVRATLSLPDGEGERAENCEPVLAGETTYCRERIFLTALTSPIYLGAVTEEPSGTETTPVGSTQDAAAVGRTNSTDPISVLPISDRDFQVGAAVLLIATLGLLAVAARWIRGWRTSSGSG
jgi:hypothetical protein